MPNIRVTVNNPTPQRISATSQTRDTVRQIGITSDATLAQGTVTSVSIAVTEGLRQSGSPITTAGTITITSNTATTAQTGIVRLQDSLLSLNTDQALTANMGRYIASLFDGKVQNTFTISTGNGLAGGGDLTTNRTIVANDASLSVNGVVRLTDVVNSTNTYGAATPNSVNAVYRVAVFANTLATTVTTAAASIRSGTVNSVSISTGTGLVQSGSPVTDSGTITVSANDASVTVNGVVRLNDTLTSANVGQALTANMGRYLDAYKVSNTDIFVGSTTRPGLVPANNAGNGQYVLTSSGTWVAPGSGGGGGSGSVTSVTVAGGNGLVSSGSPITVSGTITVSANDASATVNGVVRLQDSLVSSNTGQALTANMGVFITSQLIGKVQNTRTLSTTSPLTGGGDLTADRTLAIQAATLTQNGEVRLNDTLTSANLGQALTANMGFLITQQLVGKTQNTRLISTGFGLTGGGDLTIDRVHGVANATTTTNGVVVLQDSLVSSNLGQALTANMGVFITSQLIGKVQNTTTVSTTSPLAGGGALSSSLTLSIQAASLTQNGEVRLNDTLTSANLGQALTANMGRYLDAKSVPNTRSVLTTSPLAGGGALTSDLTLTVAAATLTSNGEVRLNDTLTSTNTFQALTANMGRYLDVYKVSNTDIFAGSTTRPGLVPANNVSNGMYLLSSSGTWVAPGSGGGGGGGTVTSVTVAGGNGLVSSGSPVTVSGTITVSANDASTTVNGVVRLNDTLASSNLTQALTANMGVFITSQFIGKVQNTRTISTTSPLAGGGDLTTDRTLSITAATLTQNGEVRLNDSLASANLGQALTANMGFLLSQQLIGKVQNTTTVSTTSPLTGGGALSSSLTLAIQAATLVQNGEVRLNDTLASANLGQALTANMGRYLDAKSVPNTRSVLTTSPLSGGGALTTDLTITIAAASLTTNGETRLNDTLASANLGQALTANMGRYLDAKSVPNTRSVISGFGLSGGGTLVADLTLGSANASLVANGMVRLQDTLTSQNTGQALTANMGFYIVQLEAGKVQNTFTLSTTSPLAGGGDLTTNRTLSISAASLTTNGETRLNDSLTSANLGQALTANMGFLLSQQLVGKVQNTTTVSTTSPLTGGGALSASLTLAIQAATLTQNGEVRLNDTLTSANLGQALTANMGRFIESKSVQNTRTISTTSPLSGGGDLTADRTLSITAATLTQNGETRLNDTLTSANLGQALTANMGRYLDAKSVPNTRSVLTTSPLSGGGALTGDVTITIGAATLTTNGETRLNDTLASTNTFQALTANQGRALNRVFSTTYDGLVPANNATNNPAANGQYLLSAAGTWVSPAGSGGGSGTVTSVTIIAGQGLVQSGSPITVAGSITVTANDATLTTNGIVRLNDTLTSANLGQALTANMGRYLDAYKVSNTTTISTTSPLTGGGDLSTNRTLAIQAATLVQNGEVRLNDTLTSANLGQALTANMGFLISQQLIGKTQNTRTISTTSPLAGGGDLTADRTLTITAATLTQNGEVRLNDTLASANLGQALTANMGFLISQQLIGKVQNTTTVSTTSPLTGGGALSASLTLAIQAASLTQNGEVRLNDTLTSANLGQALTANMGRYLDAKSVPNTRSVLTTSPLTGGGALTSDLTIVIGAATLTTNGETRLNDTLGSANLGQALTANMGRYLDAKSVPNTRSVISGFGLSGGGTLVADLTLGSANASLVANGMVRLQDTLTSQNTGQALTANMGFYIVQLEAGKVQNTFTISTTSPLTGGGDLTTNRTFAIGAATLVANGEVRLNDTLTSANLGQALTANMGRYLDAKSVPNTRSVLTTSPLAGGGALTADVTLTIGAATLTTNGETRLNDTLASTNTFQALTANQGRALNRVFSTTYDGLVPANNATNNPASNGQYLLSAAGTWVAPGGGAGGSGTVTSVTVAAGSGLVSSGSPITVSGTITLTANDASTTVNGVVRLNDTLSSANLGQALTANMGRYLDAYKVSNTTTISTTSPLTGGGDLSTNRTLAITAATLVQNGEVRLNDSLTSANLGQALTANMGFLISQQLIGKVQNTTTVSTTSPLSGGGALSSSLTLTITAATLTQNGETRLNDTLTSANLGQALTANMGRYMEAKHVSNTRQVLTTSPLSGGGDLTTDRTITITAATLTQNGETRLNDTLASANLGQALTANMGRYLDAKSVPNTRSVLTTGGAITGGGTLVADLTLTVANATTLVNGVVRLQDTLASQNTGQALTANMGFYVTQLLAGKVQNTFTLSTTSPLAGGGDLTTNRTLTIQAATLVQNGEVRLNDGLTSTNTFQALTANQGRALNRVFSSTYNGLVPTPGAAAGKVLSDDGTWITVGGTGTVTSVDIISLEGIYETGGPITGAGSITIGANNFTATANGFVPKSGTADGTKYLRDDATWVAVSSTGTSTFDYGMAIAIQRGYYL